MSSRDTEDLTLIRQVAAGDRQAFEALYQRYARPLASYVAKWLWQPEQVEEVHETLGWMGYVMRTEADDSGWTGWLEELRATGRVVLHEDFPRSAAGKTLKRELRQPYWEGRERKI